MRISARTEYGIRVLVTLARQPGGGPLSLSEIARREKLPHAYLEQLVRDLRRAGLLTATRGQAGGYRLAREADLIPMADAVRALEGPLLEMPCAGSDSLEACDRPQPCSVHEVFQRVFESLNGVLGGTTLADAAATAGGPPYPPAVRRKRVAEYTAALAAAQRAVAERATDAGASTIEPS
jgi:Rrf2 family transcriptional regulator, cysteine metabolism repressor